MGNIIHNKWRAIGIIGLIIASGIPVLLYILAQHNYYSNLLRMGFGSNDCVLTIMLLSNSEEIKEFPIFLIGCINMIQSSHKHLIAAKITFWVIISTIIVSIILILVGWIRFAHSKSEKIPN